MFAQAFHQSIEFHATQELPPMPSPSAVSSQCARRVSIGPTHVQNIQHYLAYPHKGVERTQLTAHAHACNRCSTRSTEPVSHHHWGGPVSHLRTRRTTAYPPGHTGHPRFVRPHRVPGGAQAPRERWGGRGLSPPRRNLQHHHRHVAHHVTTGAVFSGKLLSMPMPFTGIPK
jgi:hypothetical protein